MALRIFERYLETLRSEGRIITVFRADYPFDVAETAARIKHALTV
jgi:hypothetical protein